MIAPSFAWALGDQGSTDVQNPPPLSITVLNYNYAHFLPRCLDSILAQTFKDFEVLLINDCSKDNSLEVIRPYLADPRIRLIDHVENKGFAHSLKEGSEGSQSPFLTVVSADDWVLDPTAFEKQMALIRSDPDIAFVFTGYGCYRTDDECTVVMRPGAASYVKPGIEVFQDIIIDRAPLHSGTVIRRSAYEKIGGYDVNTRYAIDTKMWAGLCHTGKVGYIDEVLHAYRIHEKNMSKNKDVVKRTITELLEIIEWSFGLIPAAKRAELDWLYKKAVKKALVSYPVFFAFNENNLRMSWYFVWFGAQLRPVEALLQPNTVALMLRSVLGARGYGLVDRGRAVFSKRLRERRSKRPIAVAADPKPPPATMSSGESMATGAPPPLVSVIIPTRNRASLVQKAIESVKAEAGSSFRVEVVVVDDGSTDETPEVLGRLDVVRLNGPRRGVSAARNAGIAVATGELVTFLDDDDVWKAGAFAKLVELLEENPSFGAVCGQVLLTDVDLHPTSAPYPDPPFRSGSLFQDFLGYVPQVGSILVRRDVLDRVGGFDEALHGGEDWDWALRLARSGPMGFLPEVVLLWRMHDLPRPDGAGNRSIEDVTWQRFADVLSVGRRYLVGDSWLAQLKMERTLLKHRGHYVPLFMRYSSGYLGRGEVGRALRCGWLALKASPLHVASYTVRDLAKRGRPW